MIRKGRRPNGQSKKKQFVVFGLCSFLALVLCMVALVITVKRVEADGTSVMITDEVLQSKTMLQNDSSVLVRYIADLTAKTRNNKFVKVNSYTSVSVDDAKIVVADLNGNEKNEDKALLSYAKNRVMDTVDSWYAEDYTGTFGILYDRMPVINLVNEKDVSGSFTTGLADATGAPVYDDGGALVDEDYYYINLDMSGFTEKDHPCAEAFGMDNAPNTGELFVHEFSSALQVKSFELTPCDFEIKAKINRLTDEIAYIEIIRLYTVEADVSFVGDMSVFGSRRVQFDYMVTEHYDYYYAGITFNETGLSLQKGGEGVLTVNAVIEDDSDYKVYFTSSDEGVATVDEMGYVTALEQSDEPVIITVTLEYCGQKFTDECPVYVGTQKN